MNTAISRDDCLALDQADPLRALRSFFDLPKQSQPTIYLDGNSLGALPKATPTAMAQVITQEWGAGLDSKLEQGWMVQHATAIGGSTRAAHWRWSW